MKSLTILLITMSLAFSVSSYAEINNDNSRCNPWPECGWWFGFIDPLEEEQEEQEQQVAPKQSEAEQSQEQSESKKRCKDKQSWTVDCGFVDPGNDYAFQEIQRDQLYLRSVMNPTDPKAVEDFQYYIKWAVNQAILMAKMANFNRVQNPELDPAIKRPTGTFGIRMLANVRDLRDQEIFDAIKDGEGFLVWYTRSDCSFCHDMMNTILKVGENTGIDVWNVSLDADCFEPFREKFCYTGDAAVEAAKLLKVTIVPSLFLYIPDDNAWIRISTGIDAVTTITKRIVQFFSAVRTATAKNLDNSLGMRPPVDFSKEQMFNEKGVAIGATVEE